MAHLRGKQDHNLLFKKKRFPERGTTHYNMSSNQAHSLHFRSLHFHSLHLHLLHFPDRQESFW